MKFIIGIFMLVLLCGVVYGEGEATDIQITLLNQDPDPVTPGQYIDLKYKIENEGGVPATDFFFEVRNQFPFTADETQRIELDDFSEFRQDSQALVREIRVQVDPRALDGDNEITIDYGYRQRDKILRFSQVDTIRVGAADSSIGVKEVIASDFAPGKETELQVYIANFASTNLRDISVKLDLSSSTIPFAPIGSSTEKKIPTLLRNEEAVFTYTLLASPSASAGVYKVPINITYFDSSGTEEVTEDIIGLIIGEEPEISVIIDQHDLTQGFGRGDVPIKIVNKGTMDVKFLDVFVEETNKFSLLSPDQNYIGNLDSDDFESVDITVQNKDGEAGDITLPVTVTYKDANNKDYSQEYMLTTRLPEAEKSNGSFGIFVIIAIVIVAAIVIYRWRKK